MNPETPDTPAIPSLKILGLDHPFLRRVPTEFAFDSEQVTDFVIEEGTSIPKMSAETLCKLLQSHMLQYDLVGITANALGLDARVFVMRDAENTYAIFNPVVVGVSKTQCVMEEASASLPGVVLALTRPETVTAIYRTETGEEKMSTFTGLMARVFLHEYDHMEGRSIIDHASRFKLNRAIKSAKKRMVKQFFRQFKHNNITAVEENVV
jgi:peptide deformylase